MQERARSVSLHALSLPRRECVREPLEKRKILFLISSSWRPRTARSRDSAKSVGFWSMALSLKTARSLLAFSAWLPAVAGRNTRIVGLYLRVSLCMHRMISDTVLPPSIIPFSYSVCKPLYSNDTSSEHSLGLSIACTSAWRSLKQDRLDERQQTCSLRHAGFEQRCKVPHHHLQEGNRGQGLHQIAHGPRRPQVIPVGLYPFHKVCALIVDMDAVQVR